MTSKKIAIMQPYIFPYIGYFQLINAVDVFVFYDDVNFIKGGFINRNKILYQGKALRINVLLSKVSSFKKINEIQINDEIDWKKKFLKQIKQSYIKAPFFNETYTLFEGIINEEIISLSDFLKLGIIKICNYLSIVTEIIDSSEVYDNQELKREKRIFDICKNEKSYHYINPIGGLELYDKDLFFSEGIKLDFLKTKEIKYPQFKNNFVPNLSIIDVLMFNSKDEVKAMLNQYTLI